MRPPVPEVAGPRSRKSSFLEQQQWIDPRSTAPSTFFLARSDNGPDADELSPDEPDTSRDSMYGVQSFDETVHSVASLEAPHHDSERSSVNENPVTLPDPAGAQSPPYRHLEDEERDEAALQPRRKSTLKAPESIYTTRLHSTSPLPPSNITSPLPSTPLNFSSQDDPSSSLPSSPRSITNQSIRHLDDISIADDLSSQAVASGDEDMDPRPAFNFGADSTSQLIMPSIKMPTRRPFTERGMALGRLKVLLAGASGSGKTSLIKSIVQACGDIVHVDPIDEPQNSRSLSHVRHSSRPQLQPTQSHERSPPMSEIYASSKPYPSWWSDLEDSRVLRRRKSMGEIVLERNLCFVDTQTSHLTLPAQTDAIIQYLKQQLSRATSALGCYNNDFQNMLAGNGGSQVDVILYLTCQDTLATDIECIKKLSDWTNVIPIISKSDLLTPKQINTLKFSFNERAHEAAFKPFIFPGSRSLAVDQPPFAISSAKSNDDSIMDASTLMSPDYMQPLLPSELTVLVEKLFDRDNVAWIRHSTAKRIVQKQKEQVNQPHGPLHNPYFQISTSPYFPNPSYTMARVSDYTRREEKAAQIQLAKWASDLQRSLQNERERYAALARSERAVWLTERLGECVTDGSLVPITQTPGFCGLGVPSEQRGGGVLVRARNGQKVEYHLAPISPLDPLGVVRWSEDLKRQGWAIVQIVGSFGVVGGLALWLAKAWGLSSRGLFEWHFDWYCASD